ncbi:MAG: FG-GAP-like repeat-containing protein [bacterium]
MNNIGILISKSCVFLIIAIGSAFARQLEVVSTNPKPYAVDARFNEPVAITFNNIIDVNAINSITIYGNYHGYYALAEKTQIDSATIGLIPQPAFIQGEHITILLHNNFTSQNGMRLDLSFQFTFRTQNLAGLLRPTILPSDTVIQDLTLTGGEQQPVKIAAANFDGDPFLEAVIVSSTSSTVTILDNNGSELAASSVDVVRDPSDPGDFERTPLDVAVADFDSSGTMDIIVPFSSNKVYILWGNGNSTFVPEAVFDLRSKSNEIGAQANGITVNDFNFDGLPDFAVSSVGANSILLYHNLLNSEGRGTFQEEVTPSAQTETGIFGVASGDFNLDGLLDVAAIYNGTNAVSAFLNRRGAGFAEKTPIGIPLRPVAIRSANVIENSDNIANKDFPELLVLSAPFAIVGKQAAAAKQQSRLTILQWNPAGEGRYEIARGIALNSLVQTFALGSLDGNFNAPVALQDHDLDILTGGYDNGALDLLANNRGDFAAPVLADTLQAPRTIAVADFNRDGIEDILYASHNTERLRFIRSAGLPDTTIICDFGDVFVGQKKDTTKQIFLQNSFDVKVTLLWNDTSNFNVDPATFDLSGGALLPLRLTFSPQDTGRFFENVSVIVDPNPGGRDPATILLTGRGILVDFAIEPDSCIFPVTPPGAVSTCSLKVVNNANGTLQLTGFDIRNNTPAFQVNNRQDPLLVPAFDSTFIEVLFAPQDTGSFRDVLFIASNDTNNAFVNIPLFGRSTRNTPVYCASSPDTISIEEHQPFCFVATQGVCANPVDSIGDCIAGVFEDPDREQLFFRYQNLPSWIRNTTVDPAGNAFIRGTPGEGAQDTTFRVVAEKAFVSTEKDIYIRIIAVNNAPIFENLPDSVTIAENEQLVFQVRARDPEGAAIDLTALNLENLCGQNAQFDKTTGTLIWQPAFGCEGDYVVDFEATEMTVDSLSSFASLAIRVQRAQPDLVMDGISLSIPEIRLNQTATITAFFHNESAPIRTDEPFAARIFINNQIIKIDRFEAGMAISAVDSFSVVFTFDRTDRFSIVAEVDYLDQIVELDEDNNTVSREIAVETGQLIVRPNPFTPNGDGKNDFVAFDVKELALSLPAELIIFDMQGRRIRQISDQGSQALLSWDGRDESNDESLPGVYLYILKDANNKTLQGYVVLAR